MEKMREISQSEAVHYPGSGWFEAVTYTNGVQPVLAKMCNDGTSLVRASSDANLPFVVFMRPKQGRPFENETTNRVTLTITVAGDHSMVTITGNGDEATTRSRYFVPLFEKIAGILEKERDNFREKQKRPDTIVYPLQDEDGNAVEENNAQQIAKRLRNFLIQCVPPRQQQTINNAIQSSGASLVIDPSLQFRLPYHAPKAEQSLDGISEAAIIVTDELPQEIWMDGEEKTTVMEFFARRAKSIGKERMKDNWPSLQMLLDMYDR